MDRATPLAADERPLARLVGPGAARLERNLAASRSPRARAPTIAAHCIHVAYYVRVLDDFLSGREPDLDWPGSWRVQVVDDAAWDAVRADLRARYEQLRRTIRAQVAWGDDAIGDVMAILAHTAYHLGATRQIARAVVEAP